MEQAPNYSIEYVPPGIVRCGEFGITDYALIYREPGVELHFHCVGKRQPDGGISYVATLPLRNHVNADLFKNRKIIQDRLRAYLNSTSYLSGMHHDTLIVL
jgi:hypothetical protein